MNWEIVGAIVVGTIFCVVISLVLAMAMTTPTVQVTYPAGRCVRVIPEWAGTCDDLPDRYEIKAVSEGIR